ncbi:uncharacterized protein LOC122510787 isoform X3 [Leptopilina heterotoma]|uniref:uncharacterized protein LOC122510787 isoform X3 n=1 Tax=Leptopilina heterotoma TaxID=63436 RepID=UPI001CAA0863|nr:uncharacterized protein LOC122510787 isoform X3 [Leptopilina heterotoma]
MLNCTDLECILHHHHYHAHLHQLQSYLPGELEEDGLSTAPENIRDGIKQHENDTIPPSESVYMLCGVVIAMVLVGVIIVLLAVTISKLRKREDHANAQHPEPVVQTATPGNNVVSQTTTTTTSSSSPVDGCCTQTTVLTTSTTAVVTMDSNGVEPDPIFTTNTATAEQFIWQFPPPYPPLNTPPPQYTLYNDQDTLVHGLSADRQGFAKGFRKNLGGRWRRLVKRKPETDTCAFPPEIKDQLKTIYVY